MVFYKTLFISSIFLLFPTILFFSNKRYVFATCYPPCGSGKYECNYGNMCCTGGGCPTWMCENAGYEVKIKDGEYKCCITLMGLESCVSATRLAGTCGPCNTIPPEEEEDPYCGDGSCNGGETCVSCLSDCECPCIDTYDLKVVVKETSGDVCPSNGTLQSNANVSVFNQNNGQLIKSGVTASDGSLMVPDLDLGVTNFNITATKITGGNFHELKCSGGNLIIGSSVAAVSLTTPVTACTTKTVNLGVQNACPAPGTYILVVTAKHTKDNICPAPNDGLLLPGTLVTVQDNTPGSPTYGQIFVGTTSSDNTAIFPSMPSSATTLSVTARGMTDHGNHDLKCLNSTLFTGGVASISFSSPIANCSTKTFDIGLQALPVVSWSSVLDGDVYAPGIATAVPTGNASGGFWNRLINSPTNVGGIALSSGIVSTDHSRIYRLSYGALAQSSTALAEVPYGDIALSKFQFTPPSHATTLTFPSSGQELVIPSSSVVFTAPIWAFNDWLSGSRGTYRGISSSNAMAILYLTGSAEVNLKYALTTNGKERLLIITGSSVRINRQVGTPIASYDASNDPNIMAGIISKGNITFSWNSTTPGTDEPIMVTGPLVSRGSVVLQRNLGDTGNGLFPAQAVKYSPKILYGVSRGEYKNKDTPNYTGLGTFDVQFVYDDWNTFPY